MSWVPGQRFKKHDYKFHLSSVATDTFLKHLGEKCAQNSVKLQDYHTGCSPFSYTLLLFELNTANCVLGLFWLFSTIVLMMIYTYYFCGSEDIVLLLESEHEVWKGDCLKYVISMPLCASVATERIWITCLLFSVTHLERKRKVAWSVSSATTAFSKCFGVLL